MVVQAVTSDQRTSAHLKFSTEIVRRLGEELNPSLDKGILELAKNSYDADATECRIELRRTDRPGGEIIVQDNGDGMTADQIATGWLVLGRSSKILAQPTRLGRMPAGSKGLGRLAALRMGRTVLLSTSSRLEPDRCHKVFIDWDDFDKAKIVEDVALGITTSFSDGGIDSGTKIVITNLHTGFGRVPIRRLARELILLADPFGDNPNGFEPKLLASEYEDLESLVRNRYFTDAEYHLRAGVRSDGRASAEVFDWKGNLLYEGRHEDVIGRRRAEIYKCPPAKFNLWVYILDKEAFSLRRSSQGEVRNWLSEFGGVHFYCNGLRVSPYGGPDDDWLGMNLRRVRSPEERPGTNTSIGRIDVIDKRGLLVQKTDRSGFIEDGPFRELRAFAQDSMDWMASRRLAEAEKRRRLARAVAPKRSGSAKRRMESVIAETPSKAREDLEKAFGSYESFRDREVNLLKKEVQLYRTLSTAGITAATFAHESNSSPVKVISQSLAAIDRRARKHFGELYQSEFHQPIESIKRTVDSLTVLSTATLDLLDHEKRRAARIDLHQVVKDVLLTYGPFFIGRDIRIVKSLAQGTPFLHGQRASVESIITNLLNNSVAALEDAATPSRVIDVSTEISDLQWSLSVSDNGPGIVGLNKSEIWLPGRTTRQNGTGLGLTIVRDAVSDLGGSVDAHEKGPRGGAVFTVQLPIIGS